MTFSARMARVGGLASTAAAALSGLVLLAPPAFAATTANDKLKLAGTTASPSVVLVRFEATAYLNDSRDGSSHGPYRYGGLGTGFFVSSDGFIVTAAHVAAPTADQIKDRFVEVYLSGDARAVGCEARGTCKQLEDDNRRDYQVATSLSSLQTSISVFTQDMSTASQDTVGLPAEVKTSSPWGQRDIAVVKVNGHDEPVLQLGDAEAVQPQDAVTIIGYPGVGETSAQTVLVPTLATGIITARKEGSAELGVAPGVTIFQTDATAEKGSSGGPVVDEDARAIGLVSFGPTSTTNFMITSSDIEDLVRQAGASNAPGQIDQLWRSGLTYFDEHRYSRARTAFQQCANLNKVQVGCTGMAARATGLLATDEEARFAPRATFPFGPVAVGAGVVVLLVIGLMALVLTQRRPPRPVPPPAEPAPASRRFCSACGSQLQGLAACARCGSAQA